MDARRILILVALAAFAAIGAASPAEADILHLRNGKHIEGRVTEHGDRVTVDVGFGRLTFQRIDVARIEKKLLLEDDYEQRLRALPPADPQAAADLAGWCDARGLSEEAGALRDRALRLEVEARVQACPRDDADALYEVAAWARERGAPDASVRGILAMACEADPAHEAARAMLGHKRFRGEWRTAEEIGAILAAEESSEMRSRGLVRHGDTWVPPAEAELLDARTELALARKAVERELAALRAEREQIAELRRSLEKRGAAMQRERAQLADLGRQLDDARRELEAASRRAGRDRSVTVIGVPRRARPRPDTSPAPRGVPRTSDGRLIGTPVAPPR